MKVVGLERFSAWGTAGKGTKEELKTGAGAISFTLDYNSRMTGLAETSETSASYLAANDLPDERLALEAARRQLGVCRVFNFDRVRCGEHELVLVCQNKNI